MDRCHIHLHYSLLNYEVGQHLTRDIGVNVPCFHGHDNRSPPGEPHRHYAPVVVVGRIVRCVVVVPCAETTGWIFTG